MRTPTIVCALVLAAASAARAQDPATVDANHYKVLVDNARTRVFHVLVGPGEKVPMHGHPDAIMVPLGASTGSAYFVPAQKHAGDNPGTTPVDFIYVELKGDAPPAAAVAASAVTPSKRQGVTRTTLLENPKGCAFRSRMETGASKAAGAVPDHDQVIVALGDSELSLTVDGKTTNHWKQGDVVFIARNATYSYTNPGKPAEFVTVAIP